MTMPFSYSTTYTLDKTHFSECYDESVIVDRSKRVYFKSAILSLFGLSILLFTTVNPYAAWFVVALGILEALSIYYRKPWWLARQMLSKAAKGEVTLILDEQSITTKSFYVDSIITWQEVSKLEQTKQGWLVIHSKGRNYISARCLSSQAQAFMLEQTSKL